MNTLTLPSYYLSTVLLNNPFLFNLIRKVLAGNQENTKKFVYQNLITYKCKTVLDLGCGTGDFADACPTTISYLGTDLNKKYIQFAKKRFKQHKNKKFIQEDILKSNRNEKYDAVLLISLMHHFSDEEFKIILQGVKRITNKVVIIADIIPNPPHMIQQIGAKLDRGKFIRPKEEKLKLLKKYFTIVTSELINSRIAVQCGVICEV